MSTCRSCNAEIRWERTAAGKRIPLDPEPVPDGNLFIGGDGLVRSYHGLPLGVGLEDEPARYVTHFATCPNSAEHRRRD